MEQETNNKLKPYLQPRVRICTVAVEQGFALSGYLTCGYYDGGSIGYSRGSNQTESYQYSGSSDDLEFYF